MTTEIWHNPRCSKSCGALRLLEERGEDVRVRRYLDDPPDAAEIERVLGLLGVEPRALLRSDEPEYRSLGLHDPAKTRAELIAAMAAHPRLIQRPVVVHDGKAAIGRPPENVLALFDR